jgi:hypothetical protein
MYKAQNQTGKCGEVKTRTLTDAEKKKIVDDHNTKRKTIATGRQDGQASVANMIKLVRKRKENLAHHQKSRTELFLQFNRYGTSKPQTLLSGGQINARWIRTKKEAQVSRICCVTISFCRKTHEFTNFFFGQQSQGR